MFLARLVAKLVMDVSVPGRKRDDKRQKKKKRMKRAICQQKPQTARRAAQS